MFESKNTNFYYIGPLIAKIKGDIPQAIRSFPQNRRAVYFAMGSSGAPDIILEILTGFKGKPYSVIAPIKSLI